MTIVCDNNWHYTTLSGTAGWPNFECADFARLELLCQN